MDRAGGLAYIASEYGALASAAGLTATDDAAGFGSALDNALRALGTDESDLEDVDVPQASVAAFLALLDLFALRRLANALAGRVSTTTEAGLRRERQQAFAQTRQLLADAQARAESLGYGQTGGGAVVGVMTLDWLEPARA